MRIRTVISGIVAGVICLIPLSIQYYNYAPARFVPGWSAKTSGFDPPDWISLAVTAFCILTIFIFGWIAARWNWAVNWRSSLLAGAGAGLLAGCLIYDFIGTFWYGILGQADILQSYFVNLTEAQGMEYLLKAIYQTGTSMYLNFLGVVSGCAFAGAMGGFFSAIDAKDFWGRSPRNPQRWLFRLTPYTLVITGGLNLIVTIAVLSLFWDSLLKSVTTFEEQYGLKFDMDFWDAFFQVAGYFIGLIFILLPAGITWGWIIRDWRRKKRTGIFAVIWLLATGAGTVYYLLKVLFSRTWLFYPYDFIILTLAVFIGLLVGLSDQARSEGFPYHTSDWVGFGLANGILTGTQIVMGVPAFSVSIVLIAIVNIPHLIQAQYVPQLPVDQVEQLFGMQLGISGIAIVVGIGLGLAFASMVSFARTLFDVREFPEDVKLYGDPP